MKSAGFLIVVGVATACVNLFTLLAYASGLRVTSSFVVGGTSTLLVLLVEFPHPEGTIHMDEAGRDRADSARHVHAAANGLTKSWSCRASPIRTRRTEPAKDPKQVHEILKERTAKARQQQKKALKKVREAMGLYCS